LSAMIALSLNDDGSHRIASHEMWKLERHVEMVRTYNFDS